jgi:Mg-chelatase subunit ChlD
MQTVDFYEVLQIDRDSTFEVIRKALNQTIRDLQPAVNSRDPQVRQQAEERMKLLFDARKVLLDPVRRMEYKASLEKLEPSKFTPVTDRRSILARGPVLGGRSLDVLLLFDTTGSMYGYLDKVREGLSTIAEEVSAEVPGVRFGVIAFGDHGDVYVTKVHDFTDRIVEIKEFINLVEKTGGGDDPEAVEDALYEANLCKWDHDSKKALVLVSDAYPHSMEECPCHRDYKHETSKLALRGVRIYTVLCGESPYAKGAFQWIAGESKGVFLPLESMEDLVDLLIGICLHNTGKLQRFEEKLTKQGRMTPAKRNIIALLKG